VKSPTSQPQIIIAHPDSPASTSYEILDVLGEGASGITYRAIDLRTQRQVALKALSLARIDDWKSLELFEREAQVLSKIDREGIPTYIDYFHADVDGDRYFYIIQELAPGKTLQEWMNGKRSTEAEIKDIAIQILEHLTYLHRQQPPIVHRDLKPSNILKTEAGKIYLVDFGAVRQAYHDTFMRGSTVVGTFGYMAPEQFRGQAFPATDLYGLGATILSLLTHRSPADIPLDGLRLNFRDRIQVSPHFADWLERMLEPDVSKRFSSAIQALSVLKNPPKSKFKLGFSGFERIALGACGLIGLGLIFAVFDRYKFYCLNAVGFASTEPLVAMSNHADLKTIRNYLDRGFNVNTRDKDNHGLIYYAILHDEPKIIELAIERGADTSDANNLSDEYNKIAEKINYYSFNKSRLSEEKRISLESELRSRSLSKMNIILRYAVFRNEVKIVQSLIKNGTRVEIPIDNITTLLHIAALYQDGEMVRVLLDEGGMNPNILDRHRCTVLHTAILRYRILELNPTPVLIAADKIDNSISEKAISHLLRKGADIKLDCDVPTPSSNKEWRRESMSPIAAANTINRPDIAALIQREAIIKK
jgi:serine/threonine protein kinase